MHGVKFSIIIGSSNVGEALINYKGFEKHNIIIAGAFDIDPVKLKKNIAYQSFQRKCYSKLLLSTRLTYI